ARAEQRVDDQVGVAEVLLPVLRFRFDDTDASLRTPQQPCRDLPVATVVPRAAHDRDRLRIVVFVEDEVREPAPGALHQPRHVVACLDGAHLVRRVKRLEHQSLTIATAFASSRECDIDRSIAPAFVFSAHARTRPDSRTVGFGRPTISMSFQAKARATPNPSAFPTASLPAKRPAYDSAGFGRESQYARSASVKQRSRKRG